MSTEARTIIGAWRKDLNTYRRQSKEHVKNYIQLVDKSDDDTKERLLDIYESFFSMVEKDLTDSMYKLDDYLSRVDHDMNGSSDDEDYQSVRALPAAKRVKLVKESKQKAEETEAKAETEESEDYSTDSESD